MYYRYYYHYYHYGLMVASPLPESEKRKTHYPRSNPAFLTGFQAERGLVSRVNNVAS